MRYSSGSIELEARPCVRPRRVEVYPNISERGTSAVMIRTMPRSSESTIWPRRAEMSPDTVPKKTSGVVMVTFMMGSRSPMPASSQANLKASRPACSNATWLESTSW